MVGVAGYTSEIYLYLLSGRGQREFYRNLLASTSEHPDLSGRAAEISDLPKPRNRFFENISPASRNLPRLNRLPAGIHGTSTNFTVVLRLSRKTKTPRPGTATANYSPGTNHLYAFGAGSPTKSRIRWTMVSASSSIDAGLL
jgi:hypothetical protein